MLYASQLVVVVNVCTSVCGAIWDERNKWKLLQNNPNQLKHHSFNCFYKSSANICESQSTSTRLRKSYMFGDWDESQSTPAPLYLRQILRISFSFLELEFEFIHSNRRSEADILGHIVKMCMCVYVYLPMWNDLSTFSNIRCSMFTVFDV